MIPANDLAHCGVTILYDEARTGRCTLQCDACGHEWSPLLDPGGRYWSGYTLCPKGCN